MFQYFFAGLADRTHVTADVVRNAGLGEVLGDFLTSPAGLSILRSAANIVHKGPAGHRGVLLSPISEDQNPRGIGYHPARQTWQDLGCYWFGFEPENLPTPEQLRRLTTLIDGSEILLGDGRVWTAPKIRFPVWEQHETADGKDLVLTDRGQCYLPQAWGVDAAGKFQQSVVPEYAAAFAMAGEMANAWVGVREISPMESLNFCVRCLGLNYRVGPHEATALRLFDSTNYATVFKAAFDGEMLEQIYECVLKDADEAAEAPAE